MKMISPTLKQEYEYFLTKRASLLPKKAGKFVVIVGKEVTGTYDTAGEALRNASAKYAAGSFLIQRVFRNEEECVQKFSSMVVRFPRS